MNERPNIPLSEQIYKAGTAWAEALAAAQLLEESKTAYLSQQKSKLGEMPDSKAERIVKASDDWHEYLESMVDARRKANLAKVKYDALKARLSEWIAQDANHRAVSRA